VSELIAAPADPQDVVEDPEHVIEAVSQPPVVITEQQVAFSTAAAVPLPRTKPTRRVIAALRLAEAKLLAAHKTTDAATATNARRTKPRWRRAARHRRFKHRPRGTTAAWAGSKWSSRSHLSSTAPKPSEIPVVRY
jgi:hypothetical protein